MLILRPGLSLLMFAAAAIHSCGPQTHSNSILSAAADGRYAEGDSLIREVQSDSGRGTLKNLRRVRMVMRGMLYRGGNSSSRKGAHPLQEESLQSLCENGFTRAIYLYDENFRQSAPIDCTTANGSRNTLHYSRGGFYKDPGRRQSLDLIYNAIKAKSGPVYVHCWNGWHASGEIAAVALMQFCDWSAERAAKYWIDTVDDGNARSYERIYGGRIPRFTPIPALKLSAEEQRAYCPQF